MGLFSKKNKKRDKIEKGKPINQYDMMEQIDIDLDTAEANSPPTEPKNHRNEYCSVIAENNEYWFYGYKMYSDHSGGYTIRRSKLNPDEKLFFGKTKVMSCVFWKYLFQCDWQEERGFGEQIVAKDIESGRVFSCDWLGKGDYIVSISGYGRIYGQDKIESMEVVDEKLYFRIKRQKSNHGECTEEHDYDCFYTLRVTMENGELKPVALFDSETVGENYVPFLDEKKVKDVFTKHLIKHLGYSSEEAELAASDFPNPYSNSYLDEEYLENTKVDGIEYEKNACVTSLWKCGIVGVPMFRFYTYYAIEDIPNRTVEEYLAARKLFQVEGLVEEDFPSQEEMDEREHATFFC